MQVITRRSVYLGFQRTADDRMAHASELPDAGFRVFWWWGKKTIEEGESDSDKREAGRVSG